MSFAVPAYLAAGVAGALVVTALHFLARQRPRAAPFPTARFIPERVARAPSRALRPADLLLLAMRAAALVLLGAAFARPARETPRRGTGRVVVVDRSRAVRSSDEVRDSARAAWRPGDALVLFDSSAIVVRGSEAESIGAYRLIGARGSLSAALVAAQAAAVRVAEGADSVELVLISPFSREEWDAATSAIRAAWPGRGRVIRVGGVAAVETRGGIEIRGAPDDPLITAGLGTRHSALGTRVVRGAGGEGDSLWADRTGGVLVRWPERVRPPMSDTIGAFVMGDDVIVAPFARSVRGIDVTPGAQVIARWGDGRVAATERRAGEGCIRDVELPLPVAGDLVLRESFGRVLDGLLESCIGHRGEAPVDERRAAQLVGGPALAPGRAWAHTDAVPPLSRWLLVGAALLLVVEPVVRKRVE